jgi:predicted RNase H-like HicB family nuclease
MLIRWLKAMAEWLVNLQVEQLPEGCYLATCASIPGLVAEGSTLAETLEIARDVARQLHEARLERGEHVVTPALAKSFELPVVLSA